jgi:hypothetical protein
MLYGSPRLEKALVLAQFRRGYARLDGYLHNIGKTDSYLCEYCIECETARAFLVSMYTMERTGACALVETAGPSFGNLSQMLGGKSENTEEESEPDGRAWKLDIKFVRAAITFAMETGKVGS